MNLEKNDRYWKIIGSKLSHDILALPCPNKIAIVHDLHGRNDEKPLKKNEGFLLTSHSCFYLSIVVFPEGFLNLRKQTTKVW